MSDLRDELQAIYKQHGKLTPELVVQAARPKNHPLHPRVFDRTQKDAAESWYRHRAHELIQSVQVVYREATDDLPALRVRAFQAVQSDTQDTYVYEPTEVVVQNEFMTQLVLRNMEREWKQLYERGKAFEEFIEMVRGDLGDEEAA